MADRLIKHRGPDSSARGFTRDYEAGQPSSGHPRGGQSRRLRSSTVAALMLALLVIVGLFTIFHFTHIHIMHTKSKTPRQDARQLITGAGNATNSSSSVRGGASNSSAAAVAQATKAPPPPSPSPAAWSPPSPPPPPPSPWPSPPPPTVDAGQPSPKPQKAPTPSSRLREGADRAIVNANLNATSEAGAAANATAAAANATGVVARGNRTAGSAAGGDDDLTIDYDVFSAAGNGTADGLEYDDDYGEGADVLGMAKDYEDIFSDGDEGKGAALDEDGAEGEEDSFAARAAARVNGTAATAANATAAAAAGAVRSNATASAANGTANGTAAALPYGGGLDGTYLDHDDYEGHSDDGDLGAADEAAATNGTQAVKSGLVDDRRTDNTARDDEYENEASEEGQEPEWFAGSGTNSTTATNATASGNATRNVSNGTASASNGTSSGSGSNATAVVLAGAGGADRSNSSNSNSSQLSCGALSKELLDRYAVNNTLLITFTNTLMYKNFGPTWLYNVRKAGIKYWVLAVADNQTAHYVHSQGAHQCFMGEENEIDDTAHATFKWGSKSWRLHTWQEVLTVRHVHQLGYNVINSDIDVVWLRDPLDYFLRQYTLPDYWVSLDPSITRNALGDVGPEAGVTVHHYMNTGVYFLRATPGGAALINKWYDIRKEMQKLDKHDQDGLYDYLSTHKEKIDHDNRVSYVVDNQTMMAQLAPTLFQNAYSHTINQIHKVHKTQPFAIHFVWVWGNNYGKMMRMREQTYFIDPPEYYSGPNFLSVDIMPIEVPYDFNNFNETEPMVQTHIKAMDVQLTDMYYAFALAHLLNRTLVLPRMKCFCIQNWFENPLCRLPGDTHTHFPLDCPSDFIFNMNILQGLNVSGQPIHIREYSFLDNPRTPAEVKDDPLVVEADRRVSSATLKNNTVHIPIGLKSEELMAALSPFLTFTMDGGDSSSSSGTPKRVHVRNPRALFGGWSDPKLEEAFKATLDNLAVRWCCRPKQEADAHHMSEHHQLYVRPLQPTSRAAQPGGTER